jgi:hypothetical protein
MDEEIESLLVSVRADTAGFARDVADMRGQLEGSFGAGVERAGRVLENALVRAVTTGKFGFEDLKRVALSAMAEIAAAAVRGGIGAMFGGGSPGLAGTAAQLAGALLGLPGMRLRPRRRGCGGPARFSSGRCRRCFGMGSPGSMGRMKRWKLSTTCASRSRWGARRAWSRLFPPRW